MEKEQEKPQSPPCPPKEETDWAAEAKKLKDELEKVEKAQTEVLKQADEARKEADALKAEKERNDWVRETSQDTGVPAEVLSLVTASDRDDLAQKAESMKSYFEQKPVPIVEGDGKHPAKNLSEKQEFAQKLFGR